MFYNKDKRREMSVAEYFASTNRPLRHPKQPCVNVGRSRGRPVFIPLELCTLCSGQRRMQLTPQQQSEMISMSKQDPEIKKVACQDNARTVAAILESHGTSHSWGLAVERREGAPRMLQLPGRVLPPPTLQYGRSTAYNVGTSGSWNLLNIEFVQPGTVRSWGVSVVMEQKAVDHRGEGNIHSALHDLRSMLHSCGMTLPQVDPPVEYALPAAGGRPAGPPRGIEQLMRATADVAQRRFGAKPDFLLVLLSDKMAEPYKEVKRVSDIELGIPSQVVVATRARIGGSRGVRDLRQYWANVSLKINAKVGGVNWTLLGELRHLPVLGGDHAPPFMVMGADVSHPLAVGPSRELRELPPSVAAVVGSQDRTLGRWASRVMQQAGRREVIAGMKEATTELVQQFAANNRGHKPQRIVMYRDGVSEGQFDAVLGEELVAMVKGCAAVESGYRPAIAFIVVQKKHNTRLFPAPGSGNAASDNKGNVVPGTVVDRGIVSRSHHDFFLNSHRGLQGTNRAVHYHVLLDEIGFGADGVQLLTYWMCYLYQRATKSVSVCPPAYYADLAAYRGRLLLASSSSDSGSEAGSLRGGRGAGGGGGPGPSTGTAGARIEPQRSSFISIDRGLLNKMFYL